MLGVCDHLRNGSDLVTVLDFRPWCCSVHWLLSDVPLVFTCCTFGVTSGSERKVVQDVPFVLLSSSSASYDSSSVYPDNSCHAYHACRSVACFVFFL